MLKKASKAWISYQINLKIPFNLTSILKPHANKHSNSKYPPISEEANELLESMVTYDNKLYEIVLKKNNL